MMSKPQNQQVRSPIAAPAQDRSGGHAGEQTRGEPGSYAAKSIGADAVIGASRHDTLPSAAARAATVGEPSGIAQPSDHRLHATTAPSARVVDAEPPRRALTSARHINRALLIISMLAIVMMSLGAFFISYYFLHDQTQRHLRTLIAFTASESATALNFNDARVGEEILRAIPAAEGITSAELRDASGKLLAMVRNDSDDLLSRILPRLGGDRLSQDVVLDGQRLGSVMLEGGSGPLLHAMAGMFVFMIPVLLSVLLAALVLARRYTQRITQPILQLRTVVERLIEHRDFSQRAPPSDLAEVEELRNEFNTLLSEIALRDGLLVESNTALHRIAYVDTLTGLPNRAMFEQALQASIENCVAMHARASLFYLDIDAFKSINDTFGHSAGDFLLSEIGSRLRVWQPTPSIAARIGGDEFVVLMAPLAADQNIDTLAEDLQNTLDVPITFNAHIIHPGISIGAAIYPDMTDNVDGLIKLADQAMYAAKDERYRRGKMTRWNATSPPHA